MCTVHEIPIDKIPQCADKSSSEHWPWTRLDRSFQYGICCTGHDTSGAIAILGKKAFSESLLPFIFGHALSLSSRERVEVLVVWEEGWPYYFRVCSVILLLARLTLAMAAAFLSFFCRSHVGGRENSSLKKSAVCDSDSCKGRISIDSKSQLTHCPSSTRSRLIPHAIGVGR